MTNQPQDRSVVASCGCEWNNGQWFPCIGHAVCPRCAGNGTIYGRSGTISAEEAERAQDPSLAGMEWRERIECPACAGLGVVRRDLAVLISEAAEADEVLTAEEKDEIERRRYGDRFSDWDMDTLKPAD